MVRAALSRRGKDAEMEYAAALITMKPTMKAVCDRHLAAALEGAPGGSPLAKTIDAHKLLWGDRLATVRATASR